MEFLHEDAMRINEKF